MVAKKSKTLRSLLLQGLLHDLTICVCFNAWLNVINSSKLKHLDFTRLTLL